MPFWKTIAISKTFTVMGFYLLPQTYQSNTPYFILPEVLELIQKILKTKEEVVG